MFPTERIIRVRTKSGREFRFNITDYRVSKNTTRAETEAIAAQVVRDKYRFCEWDRKHPGVNVEAEMLEAVTLLLQHYVDRDKSLDANNQSGSDGSPWENASSETISVRATKRVSPSSLRTTIVWGVFDNSGRLVEEFAFSEEGAARELAIQLTERSRSTHFVQKVRRASE